MIKISKTEEEFRQNDVQYAHFTSNIRIRDSFKLYQIIYRNLDDANKYIRECQDGAIKINDQAYQR